MFLSSGFGIFLPFSVVVFFLFFLGWVSAFYFRKQLLVSLLSLEFVVLGLFLGVIFLIGCVLKPVSISFYLLVLGACEASLGLSLMVTMVRFSGGDMLNFLSFVKC